MQEKIFLQTQLLEQSRYLSRAIVVANHMSLFLNLGVVRYKLELMIRPSVVFNPVTKSLHLQLAIWLHDPSTVNDTGDELVCTTRRDKEYADFSEGYHREGMVDKNKLLACGHETYPVRFEGHFLRILSKYTFYSQLSIISFNAFRMTTRVIPNTHVHPSSHVFSFTLR